MIRKWLHMRLLRLYDPDRELAILSCEWELRHWRWMDRYNDWHVARYGEYRGAGPLRHRLLGRIICWISDWRTTLSLWFGRNEWKKWR